MQQTQLESSRDDARRRRRRRRRRRSRGRRTAPRVAFSASNLRAAVRAFDQVLTAVERTAWEIRDELETARVEGETRYDDFGDLPAKVSRVAKTGTRTDDDIMDEAAGQHRLQLAADSKERKANEKAELARKNAEMRDMITNTPPAYLDHAGSSTGIYAAYNTHLQDKIGGSPARSKSPPPS